MTVMKESTSNISRRTILRSAAVAGAGALLLPINGALAAEVDEDAILATVNPELRAMAKVILPFTSKGPPLSRATLAAQRAGMSAYAQKPLADVAVEARTVPGLNGQPEVAIYVINAKPGAARPGIVHTHGGGFIMGSAKDSVRSCQELAATLDCTVVTVEYRLAPETIWSGSLADNYAALKWVHANAAALGIDPTRIAVAGESAGGGHAALLAIAARDRGEVPLAFQCLTYPMLDDRTGSSRRVPPHVGQIIWTPERNRFGWECFLGSKPGGSGTPKGAVPARLGNLAGLAPAWIGVGSIDLFHDEDVEYARRLNDAGVPTELIVVPGAFHGFDNPMLSAKISNWFIAARIAALRAGLGITG